MDAGDKRLSRREVVSDAVTALAVDAGARHLAHRPFRTI
jgi:hypothetical protein